MIVVTATSRRLYCGDRHESAVRSNLSNYMKASIASNLLQMHNTSRSAIANAMASNKINVFVIKRTGKTKTTCRFTFEKSSITIMVEHYNLMYAEINAKLI